MSPQISTAQGVIQGEERISFDGTRYYSFEGIPYAKPPVGNLRFRDPQPPDSWSDVRDCTKPGNKCAQINPLSKKGFEGSEDCLYLNIYTPSLELTKKLPVLFFIHGGRLTFGYGDYYQPEYLIRHDVILVTINYRLNILGFLSLDTPEVPGNAGIKDCVAALRWVRGNIENFAGNVNNITILGESAGGAICTSFLCSKMTEGLFHKIVTQSGNHLGDVFMCVQDHVAVAKRVAKTLGKEIRDKNELLHFFRSLTVKDLVNGYTMTKNPRWVHPLLMAVVEKEFSGVERFIHEAPIVTFRSNRFLKVPTIVGRNIYEGAAFVFQDKTGRVRYQTDFKKYVPSYMYLEDNEKELTRIGNKIGEYYFKGRPVGDETKMEYIRLLSDTFFGRDITNYTEIVAKNNDECYAYNFHYVGNLNIGVMKNLGVHGTTHGDSIQYQFYRRNQDRKTTVNDKNIIDFFSEAFTNFAKYSKPTWSKQKLQWLPYKPTDKLTLIVDNDMRLEKNADWESFVFWNSVCGERAKL